MEILSTHNPTESIMLITPKLPENITRSTAACIAGHKNFTALHIQKYGLNKIYGFGEKLFGVFAKHRISCQHYLTGIHKMCVILKDPVFDIRRDQIINDINGVVAPDSVKVDKGLAMIAVVGEGMGTVKGIFSRVFDAISLAGVKAKMIEHGADDLNIIIGVADEDYEKAITSLYKHVVKNEEVSE